MAQTSSARPSAASVAAPIASDSTHGSIPDWLALAAQQGLKPEQLLACVGLGWLGHLREEGEARTWSREDSESGGADLASLRQRLEVIQLAVQTGAPLTTAEVTTLLGARPGADLVERGGLRARRISRNVWKLSRSGEGRESSGSVVPFSEGFRRRL